MQTSGLPFNQPSFPFWMLLKSWVPLHFAWKQFLSALELLTFQSIFHTFNLIWSLHYLCEVGRADIIKPIWIMNKKAQEDKVFGFMSFEKVPWSPDGQCIFFFLPSREPKDLSILFFSSHVLAPAGGGGMWERYRREKKQKAKMLTWLTYRWCLISEGEVRAPADNDVCIIVLNGNGAVPAPSKTNLPKRYQGPAQQEWNSHWGQLLELYPKPLLVSEDLGLASSKACWVRHQPLVEPGGDWKSSP